MGNMLCDTGSAQDIFNPNLVPDLFEQHSATLTLLRPPAPGNLEEWQAYQSSLRRRHAKALGIQPDHTPSPVEYEVIATVERRGYTLKKILFESSPHVPIPAHLYFPKKVSGRVPGVLCVHGHWPEAKNAPAVHARCVFLAMRGFVVLALDAMGAGERAYQGITYHGRQLGYQVLPSGMTLAGLQVLDNRRAIDLLSSLPEVDPDAIGVTGASGGGNQTFHISILDERVKAAVAVCFFGAYSGYLRGAHCSCELVPGVLTYAEEGNLAGLVAPRSLMIVAAKEDVGAAFRIEDARRNSAVAQEIYDVAGVGDRFRFVEFEGGHDYSQSMREAMVAFFEKHLMGKDSGETVPEPDLDAMTPEELRVLKDERLPEGSLFVPQITAIRVSQLVKEFDQKDRSWARPEDKKELRERLVEHVLGGFPVGSPLSATPVDDSDAGMKKTLLSTEPGVEIELRQITDSPDIRNTLLVLGSLPDDHVAPDGSQCSVFSLFPRGAGPSLWSAANAVDCEDYLLAQGSSTLGRPMLGQWVWDALRAAEFLRDENGECRIAYFGEGIMGLVAILAGVLDDKCAGVGAADFLDSYQWPDRFDDRWGLVHFVPRILKCGDIPQIASGIVPHPFVAASPRNGGGEVLGGSALEEFRRNVLGKTPPKDWPGLKIDPRMSAGEALAQLASTVGGER
jgi:dienelactone hydrolase